MHLLHLPVMLFPLGGSRIRDCRGCLFICPTGDGFTTIAAQINAKGLRPWASLLGINLIVLSSSSPTSPLSLPFLQSYAALTPGWDYADTVVGGIYARWKSRYGAFVSAVVK